MIFKTASCWWFLAIDILVCQGIQVEEADRSLQKLKLLQWNLHHECFLRCNESVSALHCDEHYPFCSRNATLLLQQLLANVDFAGLEQLSDPTFYDQLDSNLGHIEHLCGGARGLNTYPVDHAGLIFDQRRWKIKMDENGEDLRISGCMDKVNQSAKENDYRAYLGQAFVHKETGLELIVLVAHYPHEAKYQACMKMLAADLAQLKHKAKVKEVLLVADTNQPRTNFEIMQDLNPSARNVVGSDPHLTCCYPAYLYPYDRIILSQSQLNATSQKTTLPFGNESMHRIPDWVTINMHDPVLLEVHLAPAHSSGVRAALTLIVFSWILLQAA